MSGQMTPTFVSYAADVIADTSKGLSGTQFLKITNAYGAEWGVDLPHTTYPFSTSNKRTALYENLIAFSQEQRFQVILELCDHHVLRQQNAKGAAALKESLMSKFGHLAGKAVSPELDEALLERTQHFLGPYPDSLSLFESAITKHASGAYLRNVLDDLRLSLELLLKGLLQNAKSLENQIPLLADFLKPRGGSRELANMFVKLVEYYTKYQNTYIKHDDAVIEEEVEFIFELTASFMKHFVRLSERVVSP